MKLDFERTFSNFIGMISLKNERIWIKFIETCQAEKSLILQENLLFEKKFYLHRDVV